jgi:hypothetical protein
MNLLHKRRSHRRVAYAGLKVDVSAFRLPVDMHVRRYKTIVVVDFDIPEYLCLIPPGFCRLVATAPGKVRLVMHHAPGQLGCEMLDNDVETEGSRAMYTRKTQALEA